MAAFVLLAAPCIVLRQQRILPSGVISTSLSGLLLQFKVITPALEIDGQLKTTSIHRNKKIFELEEVFIYVFICIYQLSFCFKMYAEMYGIWFHLKLSFNVKIFFSWVMYN